MLRCLKNKTRATGRITGYSWQAENVTDVWSGTNAGIDQGHPDSAGLPADGPILFTKSWRKIKSKCCHRDRQLDCLVVEDKGKTHQKTQTRPGPHEWREHGRNHMVGRVLLP